MSLTFLISAQAQSFPTGENCERVVWEYIDLQFEAARDDSTYWRRRWHFDVPPDKSELRLGRPFTHHHLNAPELEAFVRSGDLLGAAFVADFSYPLYVKDRFITTVQVVDSSGTCMIAGRHGAGSFLDSLAVAEQENGYTVKTVTVFKHGTYLLITGPASPETRLMRDKAIDARLDANKTVAYPELCEVLRPRVEEWLAKHKERMKKEQK